MYASLTRYCINDTIVRGVVLHRVVWGRLCRHSAKSRSDDLNYATRKLAPCSVLYSNQQTVTSKAQYLHMATHKYYGMMKL